MSMLMPVPITVKLWRFRPSFFTTNGPVVGSGGVSTRRNGRSGWAPAVAQAARTSIATAARTNRLGAMDRIIPESGPFGAGSRSDGSGQGRQPKTDRGAFGPAHAFPKRERFLLGTSVRQKMVPSDPDSREGTAFAAGG